MRDLRAALGVGLLTGNHGQEEMERAGRTGWTRTLPICTGAWTSSGFGLARSGSRRPRVAG